MRSCLRYYLPAVPMLYWGDTGGNQARRTAELASYLSTAMKKRKRDRREKEDRDSRREDVWSGG